MFWRKKRDSNPVQPVGNVKQAVSDQKSKDVKQVTPPSYGAISTKYESIAKGAESIYQASATHTKSGDLKNLQDAKSINDAEYAKAVEITGNAPKDAKKDTEQDTLEQEKEKAQKSKDDAEQKLSRASDRVGKSTKNRTNLEKYKGKMLVRVVEHASLLDKESKLMEEDLDLPADATPEQKNLANYKKALQEDVGKRQAAGEAADKKAESKEKHMERSGIASTILGHIGGLFGTVSDSVGVLADKGIEAKESVDKLAKAKDFWKEAGDSFKMEDAMDKAEGSFSYMASILALLNTVYSVVDLGKACAEVHKRRKDVSGQERFADARMILEKLADVFSNVIGFIGPYISFVPFLGSALNIADNAVQLVLCTVNLGSNGTHRVMISHDKGDLWEKIEEKRKKYAGSTDPVEKECASFFDIDEGSKSEKRKESFKKIDIKRRKLLEIVAKNEGIAGQTQEQKKHEYQMAKNFNEFRGAESSVSGRISKLREERHKWMEKKEKGIETKEENEQYEEFMGKYKRRMRAMEALELFSQYRTEEKAGKKMNKAIRSDVEGLITNFWKLGGNITKLIGEVTAATGYGATLILAGTISNIAEGGYEALRDAGAGIYKLGRKLSGAEANKLNTRQEMGMFLYDKMVSIGPENVPWTGDFFDLSDNIPDYKIRQENESMNELHNTLNRGLDARMSSMVITPTKDALIDILASAFGQD